MIFKRLVTPLLLKRKKKKKPTLVTFIQPPQALQITHSLPYPPEDTCNLQHTIHLAILMEKLLGMKTVLLLRNENKKEEIIRIRFTREKFISRSNIRI